MVDDNEDIKPVEQELEEVARKASEVGETAQKAAAMGSDEKVASKPVQEKNHSGGTRNLDLILDVNLQVTVEVGRSRMTIQDLLQLGQGSVMELEKLAGESLDIYVNGKKVARGEAVIVNEKFGVRLTDIISQEDRIETLAK